MQQTTGIIYLPVQCQAIILSIAELLSARLIGTSFREIWIKIKLLYNKMNLNIVPAKYQPFQATMC